MSELSQRHTHAEEVGHTADRKDGAALWLALGRALYGGFFLYNGINHFAKWRTMSEYAKSKEVPLPELAVCASGALIAAGGLSVLTGVRPRAGASMIAGFLLGVSPQMHAFWTVDDPQARMNEMVHFSKNMALLGAACFVAAVPEPWPGRLNVRGLL